MSAAGLNFWHDATGADAAAVQGVLRSITAKKNRLCKIYWAAAQAHWQANFKDGVIPPTADITDAFLQGYFSLAYYAQRHRRVMPGKAEMSARLEELKSDQERAERMSKIAHFIHRHGDRFSPGVYDKIHYTMREGVFRLYVYQTQTKLDLENRNVGVELCDKFSEAEQWPVMRMDESTGFHTTIVKIAPQTASPVLVMEHAPQPGNFHVILDWRDGYQWHRQFRVSDNLNIRHVPGG